MKRALAYFLVLIYVSMSAGYTLYSHFCMDRLVDISMLPPSNPSEGNACGLCKADDQRLPLSEKSGCCKEVAKEVKVDVSHQSSGYFLKGAGPDRIGSGCYDLFF